MLRTKRSSRSSRRNTRRKHRPFGMQLNETRHIRRLWHEQLEDRRLLSIVEWDGGPLGTGTNWHDPVNWDGDVLPTSADDVMIGTDFSDITIASASTVTINSVASHANMQITGGTFAISSASTINGDLTFTGGILDVGGTLTLAGAFTFANGTLKGGGDVTATDQFAWSAGTMTGAGQTVIAAGATGTISGTGDKYLGRTLANAGTVNYTGSRLYFGPTSGVAGVIDNQFGGVFNVIGEGDFTHYRTANHAFHNAGTFTKTGS